jgi:hypothetical protein
MSRATHAESIFEIVPLSRKIPMDRIARHATGERSGLVPGSILGSTHGNPLAALVVRTIQPPYAVNRHDARCRGAGADQWPSRWATWVTVASRDDVTHRTMPGRCDYYDHHARGDEDANALAISARS